MYPIMQATPSIEFPASAVPGKEKVGGFVSGMWGKFVKAVAREAKDLPATIKAAVIGLAAFAWSLVVLAWVLAGIAVAIYLLYKRHPRPLWISHSTVFEEYMDHDYLPAVVSNMRTLNAGLPTASARLFGGDAVGQATGALRALLARPDLHGDLRRYLQYKKALMDPQRKLNTADLRNDAAFMADGDVDSNLVGSVVVGVVAPVAALRSAVRMLSNLLSQSTGTRDWKAFSEAEVRVATAVHMLQLLLNDYHDDILFSYATRKSGMPLAIWTLYFWPYVKDIFTHRIPDIWKKAPADYVNACEDFMVLWERLGVLLSQIPCYMAINDPVERAAKCGGGGGGGDGDSFVGGGRPAPAASAGAAGAAGAAGGGTRDVVERFSLGGVFTAIGKFFINMMVVFVAVGTFFGDFASDPFGSIVGLIALVLGCIVGLVLMLTYMLSTVLFLFIFPMSSYATALSFGGAFMFTLFQLAVVCSILLPYAVLWIIDMITNGAVVRLMRCESLPNAWAEQPSWAHGNTWVRFGLLCLYPCARRYHSSDEHTACMLCERLDGGVPDLCPQQLIFQLFSGGGGQGTPATPWNMARFKPGPQFTQQTVDMRKELLSAAFEAKNKHMGACYAGDTRLTSGGLRKLPDMDYINRHVCACCEHPGLWPAGSAKEERAKDTEAIKLLCRETYCDYAESDGGIRMTSMQERNGEERAKLCKGLVTTLPPAAAGDAADLFKRTLLLGIAAVILFTVLVVMLITARSAFIRSADAAGLKQQACRE
jgi:hypothetical protein